MSNYSKWDKFDPDLVCKEIDVQQSIESSKAAKKKAFTATATENEQSIIAAKKAAEALQSQTDVAALKAKGMGGRRKREKAAEGDAGPNITPVSAVAPAQPQRTIAERLASVTDFLYRLLKKVEQLRACTEKKQSHNHGYQLAIHCLSDIRTFSRIKNATVLATLRSASADTASVTNSSVKIMEDLNASEAFLIEQTVNCLSLFALSRGEYALAADASRFVLKRQGSLADAGIWLMRGLAFAGMGAPYLAKLHFSSASSVNADYAGLKECMPALDAAQVAHARRTFGAKKEDLVNRELARAVRHYFAPRGHILKEVPDLAVLTTAEVQNFMSEGYTAEQDPIVVFQLDTLQAPAVLVDAQQLHVEDGSVTSGTAASSAGESVASEVSAAVLQSTIERLVREHAQKGKSATSSSPFAALLASECGKGGAEKLCTATALQILRQLFYEAQVLFLESLWQSAELKYAACLVMAPVVCALAEAAHSASVEGERLVETNAYVRELAAACYINTAVCMAHRSPPGRRSGARNTSTDTSTRTADAVTAVSARDLVGGASSLRGPLDWCDRGLQLRDTLAGRLRRLYVLQHLHRFREALEECEGMIARARTEQGGAGTLVASRVGDHAHSLSQQFFCGFPLLMPVPSLLGSDAIDVGGDPTTTDADLNFDFLTMEDAGSREEVQSAAVRSDGEVTSEAWLLRLRGEGERIRHLLRKYGDDA